jgi:hypothetical protein
MVVITFLTVTLRRWWLDAVAPRVSATCVFRYKRFIAIQFCTNYHARTLTQGGWVSPSGGFLLLFDITPVLFLSPSLKAMIVPTGVVIVTSVTSTVCVCCFHTVPPRCRALTRGFGGDCRGHGLLYWLAVTRMAAATHDLTCVMADTRVPPPSILYWGWFTDRFI